MESYEILLHILIIKRYFCSFFPRYVKAKSTILVFEINILLILNYCHTPFKSIAIENLGFNEFLSFIIHI